jgi:hypothetical protein
MIRNNDKFMLVLFVIWAVFIVYLIFTYKPLSNKNEAYINICHDAGGIPVIAAAGPNVCINPGAVIKDMNND